MTATVSGHSAQCIPQLSALFSYCDKYMIRTKGERNKEKSAETITERERDREREE